ncbi:hypothetical protein [Solimonas marina]|uniref:HPr kinase/phosphorylase C-terminal domain-containing protein n=1 Tax=Solimonas marina TaxID=2714601 RepID=A0A969WBT3_9GAMM|nr:hypothetical protein [Solimonas marina]NKF24057.1 hypothetical protein [Solimonas marina]
MPRPSAPNITLHGVFMRVHGTGVLLTGASGVGKSELALELLTRGHRLVADDAVDFSVRRGFIIGRAPRLLRGFMEARSLGILNITKLYGSRSVIARQRLDLVVHLEAPRIVWDSGMERLGGRRSQVDILGVELPEITVPIRLGHNLAVLVEAACRDQQLRLQGYRADIDLIERQAREIRAQQRPDDAPDHEPTHERS